MVCIGVLDRDTTQVPTALDRVSILPYKVTYNVSQFFITHQDMAILDKKRFCNLPLLIQCLCQCNRKFWPYNKGFTRSMEELHFA